MSASEDYLKHIGRMYRMDAPAAEKIRWHERLIVLVQAWAREDTRRESWARDQVESARKSIVNLRKYGS